MTIEPAERLLTDSDRRRSRRHRRPGRRRWRWPLALLAAAVVIGIGSAAAARWGSFLQARFQLRWEQTLSDLPHESAAAALPPLCFLLSLILAGALGVAVYKMGRVKGFVLASINTGLVFLLGVWAISTAREPLASIELRYVQWRDVLYVLSFFTVVLIPVSSYFAWYRASLR